MADRSSLAGRVALLTGASGIGRALGRRLIADGVRPAFAYGTSAEPAVQLVAEAKAAGLDAIAIGDNFTLAVNLRAPFLLAQAVLPGMTDRGFGRVLFTHRSRASRAV